MTRLIEILGDFFILKPLRCISRILFFEMFNLILAMIIVPLTFGLSIYGLISMMVGEEPKQIKEK